MYIENNHFTKSSWVAYPMGKPPLFLDSITDASADAMGRTVVCGSHGGLYPAALAAQAALRAVLFNDAGIGLDRAGVAGVMALADASMAAAAVDCQSCHIGSAQDMWDRGRISVANGLAENRGIQPGMAVVQACDRLARAPLPTGHLPPVQEARKTVTLPGTGTTVELLDSASLVVPTDTGKILITGSHGALIGGDPKRALKAPGHIAVFNDAGMGADNIGTTRLPALDTQNIAAVTVSAATARIGDAASALETGVISAVNPTAAKLGAKIGSKLVDWLVSLG